jgi:hypothetical protein
MKKILFIGAFFAAFCGAFGAIAAVNVLTPKKADSVAKQDFSTSTTNVGASLLPAAATLVANVIALNQQQKALVAECEPTSREIEFVNKMVKEWAYTGVTNPLLESRGLRACMDNETYESTVRQAGTGVTIDTAAVCYDTFTKEESHGAVWAGFPKATVVEYCTDGSALSMCSRNNRKKMTNMWMLFDMIDFDNKDYTNAESSQAQALLQKATNCSGNKLAAKRLETFGGFVTSTIGNMGQKTNTGSIMESVSTIVGSTGIGGISSLAGVATQFLDR